MCDLVLEAVEESCASKTMNVRLSRCTCSRFVDVKVGRHKVTAMLSPKGEVKTAREDVDA